MSVQTLTGLSAAQRTVLEEETLVRALPKLYHIRWAQRRPLGPREGKAVTFTRWTSFPVATTPLVEGEVPAGEALTPSTTTITPSRYGSYIYIGRVLAEEGIFDQLRDNSQLLGEQAALTSDTLSRSCLIAGTSIQYADGQTGNGDITASMVLDREELLKALQTLESNDAQPVPEAGDNFVLIFHPKQGYDLYNDAGINQAWIQAGQRGDANPVWGRPKFQWMGIRGYQSSNVYCNTDAGSGNVDLYYALMIGRNAYGVAGYGALMANYVEGGTGEEHRPVELMYHPFEDYPPMNDKMSLAWIFSQEEAILNNNFIIVIRTASSIGSN